MNKRLKTIVIGLIAIAMCFPSIIAQEATGKNEFNPVQTGVNSLNIAPDARGASMGDLGVATDPDVNSKYWKLQAG